MVCFCFCVVGFVCVCASCLCRIKTMITKRTSRNLKRSKRADGPNDLHLSPCDVILDCLAEDDVMGGKGDTFCDFTCTCESDGVIFIWTVLISVPFSSHSRTSAQVSGPLLPFERPNTNPNNNINHTYRFIIQYYPSIVHQF